MRSGGGRETAILAIPIHWIDTEINTQQIAEAKKGREEWEKSESSEEDGAKWKT